MEPTDRRWLPLERTASVPGTVLGAVIVITLLYVAATELAKLRFYRKFA